MKMIKNIILILLLFCFSISKSQDIRTSFFNKEYSSQSEMSDIYCVYRVENDSIDKFYAEIKDTTNKYFIMIGYSNTSLYFNNVQLFDSFRKKLKLNTNFYISTNTCKVRVNYFTNKIIIENRIDHTYLYFTKKELMDFISWLDNLSFKI